MDLDNLSGATNHNGGAIHFGPDGKLYAAVGENANAANAQTLTNRLGKILRYQFRRHHPDRQPFLQYRDRRQPRDLGARLAQSLHLWVSTRHGPACSSTTWAQSTWEEINDGIAGSNYGWPNCEGACSPANANFRDPLFQYGHGTGPTTGCAIVGARLLQSAGQPISGSYLGKYFFADLCSGWIRVFDPATGYSERFRHWHFQPGRSCKSVLMAVSIISPGETTARFSE